MKEALDTLSLGYSLIAIVFNKLGLLFGEDDYAIICKDGTILESYDYEFLDIPLTSIKMKDDNIDFVCDGVLFFGDGCVEFHDAESRDAFNWSEFTDESILLIIEKIKDLDD